MKNASKTVIFHHNAWNVASNMRGGSVIGNGTNPSIAYDFPQCSIGEIVVPEPGDTVRPANCDRNWMRSLREMGLDLDNNYVIYSLRGGYPAIPLAAIRNEIGGRSLIKADDYNQGDIIREGGLIECRLALDWGLL